MDVSTLLPAASVTSRGRPTFTERIRIRDRVYQCAAQSHMCAPSRHDRAAEAYRHVHPRAAVPAFPLPPRPPMRALIADDDQIITTILSSVLSRMGMQVTVAHDGDVAWQALNSVQP